MQITLYEKHVKLNDRPKKYINDKISRLGRKGERVDDESTLVKVEIEGTDVKTSNGKLFVVVNMIVPHSEMRAEVEATTVEEGIDLAVDKLKKQLEKYKG